MVDKDGRPNVSRQGWSAPMGRNKTSSGADKLVNADNFSWRSSYLWSLSVLFGCSLSAPRSPVSLPIGTARADWRIDVC
eukprot:scaffold10131_cov73-Cylindrotheca_fusiformis.AAC.1